MSGDGTLPHRPVRKRAARILHDDEKYAVGFVRGGGIELLSLRQRRKLSIPSSDKTGKNDRNTEARYTCLARDRSELQFRNQFIAGPRTLAINPRSGSCQRSLSVGIASAWPPNNFASRANDFLDATWLRG
jgi:hypothetical protein